MHGRGHRKSRCARRAVGASAGTPDPGVEWAKTGAWNEFAVVDRADSADRSPAPGCRWAPPADVP
jgi:hypothetical protein